MMSKSRSSAFVARLRALRRGASTRAVLGRLFALFVAAVVFVGALTAGCTYLWCSMMQQRVEACCCEPRRSGLEAPAGDEPRLENGCCEDRRSAGIDVGRVAADILDVSAAPPAAAPAPTIAIPAAATSSIPLAPRLLTRAQPPRAGPQRASDRCARLQVFRC